MRQPVLVLPLAPREGDEAQVVRQPRRRLQVIQRRQQLVDGQVTGGAEDDEVNRADYRSIGVAQSLSAFTAWPPKPWRIIGQQLVGVVVFALAGEAHHQCQTHHRRGHALLDRFQRGPAAFAGIGHQRRDVVQLPDRASGNRRDRSSSQERTTLPCRHSFGDGGQVEIEIGACLHQREAFGKGLHHAVLDAVVDHLDEVAGADRAGVQPAASASAPVPR